MFAMAAQHVASRERDARAALRTRRIALFVGGFAALRHDPGASRRSRSSREGGWITLLVTRRARAPSASVVRRHYRRVGAKLQQALRRARQPAECAGCARPANSIGQADGAWCSSAAYGGLGIHTVLNIFRAFPGTSQDLVFISVGVVDSGEFKGEDAVDGLKATHGGDAAVRGTRTRHRRARRLPLRHRHGRGRGGRADLRGDRREFPKSIVFAGKIIFRRERWYQPVLHNETAIALQKRLQWRGITMVILPVRVREL